MRRTPKIPSSPHTPHLASIRSSRSLPSLFTRAGQDDFVQVCRSLLLDPAPAVSPPACAAFLPAAGYAGHAGDMHAVQVTQAMPFWLYANIPHHHLPTTRSLSRAPRPPCRGLVPHLGGEGEPLGPWSCLCHTTSARSSSLSSKDRSYPSLWFWVWLCVEVCVLVIFRPAHRGFVLQQELVRMSWSASWRSLPTGGWQSELARTQAGWDGMGWDGWLGWMAVEGRAACLRVCVSAGVLLLTPPPSSPAPSAIAHHRRCQAVRLTWHAVGHASLPLLLVKI